jgi:hypothetical protein
MGGGPQRRPTGQLTPRNYTVIAANLTPGIRNLRGRRKAAGDVMRVLVYRRGVPCTTWTARRIASIALASTQRGRGTVPASINGRRLRRGELAQLEFSVVVEEPVFEQFQMAAPIEKIRRRLR